jgi:hypothetical protein
MRLQPHSLLKVVKIVGGQWLPDEDPASGVALTGLYPDLRTNTPVHMSGPFFSDV